MLTTFFQTLKWGTCTAARAATHVSEVFHTAVCQQRLKPLTHLFVLCLKKPPLCIQQAAGGKTTEANNQTVFQVSLTSQFQVVNPATANSQEAIFAFSHLFPSSSCFSCVLLLSLIVSLPCTNVAPFFFFLLLARWCHLAPLCISSGKAESVLLW